MKPIVFLGSSLAQEEARPVLEAEFRPPLRAGDLDALPDRSKVAIIDGLLEPCLRLPTAEAVRALDRGFQLFGAASTGALLATRLERRGMTGVGRVFFFLRGLRDGGEDLVAVLQRESDAKPLTIPLVNIVLSLFDQAKVKPEQLTVLLKRLRAIPLTRRYLGTVSAQLARILQEDFAAGGCFSIFNHKASDALLLLHLLRSPAPYLRL